MPSLRTRSTSGCRPRGQTSGETTQSPSPESSSRREPNQPSSSTYRSTPTAAARSARSSSRSSVVLEVDGLPHVEGDRPVGGDPGRAGAQVPVEPAGDLVQAGAVRAVDPRAAVALAGGQPHLARQQQLAAADHLLAGEDPLGVVRVVAAPRGVHRPHVAGSRSRTRRCRRAARRRCPGRSGPCGSPAGGCRSAAGSLRHPLQVVPPGEVEQFGRRGRHREGQHQVVHCVRLGGQVAHGRPACAAARTGSSSRTSSSSRRPASSVGRNSSRPGAGAAKPVTGCPVERTRGRRNAGDQPSPANEPRSPGRPVQPVRCSGSIGHAGRGLDVVRPDHRRTGARTSAAACAASSAGSSGPQ